MPGRTTPQDSEIPRLRIPITGTVDTDWFRVVLGKV